MTKQNPYNIVKHQHITEKSSTLLQLKDSDSNRSSRRCEQAKYVFIVDPKANKRQISEAVEEIYSEQQVKVTSVNTINVKGKKKRVRGHLGKTAAFKKAVVTLAKGDTLENV